MHFKAVYWQYVVIAKGISKEGVVYMGDLFELNRLEFMILKSLYDGGCTEHYHSMTITDLMNDNEGTLGTRMTIYRKMKKLVKTGYIRKGCLDNHADTFYLLEKGIKLVEGGKRE